MADTKLLDMEEVKNKVSISLCYKTKDYPFNHADCSIADISHSEEGVTINCPEIEEYISNLEKEVEELKKEVLDYRIDIKNIPKDDLKVLKKYNYV